MNRIPIILVAILTIGIIACDDEKVTGESDPKSFVDTSGSAMAVTDTTSAKAAANMPFDIVPNATAQKWYADYMALIAASTPPNPPTGTTPAFDVTKIITQINLSNELSKELKKLNPQHIKFCIALKPGNKPTVLIQVRLVNDTFVYYDMSDPAGARTYSTEDPFCPPPPGCALEESM